MRGDAAPADGTGETEGVEPAGVVVGDAGGEDEMSLLATMMTQKRRATEKGDGALMDVLGMAGLFLKMKE